MPRFAKGCFNEIRQSPRIESPEASVMFHASVSPAWKAALLCVTVFGQALANDCTIPPLSLPITNNTLADGIALNRGIFAQIGGEQVGLRISTLFNNTRVRNARDCEQGNATSESGCIGASGSVFDPTKSPTWVTAALGDWNASTVDPLEAGETDIDGWDVVEFYSNTVIPGFPLVVWSDLTSDNKSEISFGPESSFLDWLLYYQQVPSTVFGIFFGSRSQLYGVDGNVTIGGYDRARVQGAWTNFSMQDRYLDTPCPLQVLIQDIRLNNDDGSFSLFLDSGVLAAACVDPLANDFTLTQSMWDRFANLTQLTSFSADGQPTYPLSADSILGNLSITLANGYETVIPHYELVGQLRGTDSEGKYSVVNASELTVAISVDNGTAGEIIPILGGVYLSLNYLLVDYENQVFSLAPAVQGNLDDQAHDIVPICNSVAPVGNGSGGTRTLARSLEAWLGA